MAGCVWHCLQLFDLSHLVAICQVELSLGVESAIKISLFYEKENSISDSEGRIQIHNGKHNAKLNQQLQFCWNNCMFSNSVLISFSVVAPYPGTCSFEMVHG